MRILLTNDDGPPSNSSSPYVHTLISALQQAGHEVFVCLPDVQRSWIGKAHMVGQTLKASYFRPGTILKDDGIVSEQPFDDAGEQWVLVNGTPASCVQIGLHHVFKSQGPFDLVLSGPNYGRNTTALFALSSGTIGGAMEGAVNGVKSIALSYAFDSREHDADIIAAASRVSTKLIEKFVAEWPEDVHLYSINVPLRKGVEETKIVYTEMTQNRWHSSSFTELPARASDADPNEEEKKIRENGQGNQGTVAATSNKVTYKWSPYFADVRKSVEDAGQGDGWSVLQGYISVTPLRANFWHVSRYTGEIKLDNYSSIAMRPQNLNLKMVYALIDYPEPYVQPLITRALQAESRLNYNLIRDAADTPSIDVPYLQFTAYESLDFERAASRPKTSLICAYMIRKALIRKHYLSNTVSTWLVKHPKSILARHFKPAAHFEVDFAEFLDEALVDAWDLNESMQRNEAMESSSDREWWILKPGMSDGGNGIRLFSTLQELQEIFEEWDPAEDSEDVEDDDALNTEGESVRINSSDTGLEGGHNMASQLRHFIAQPYIDPPLLLSRYGNRKFNIRTYVVAAGALRVYVYREMLALFAAKSYCSPGLDYPVEVGGITEEGHEREIDLSQHLTNTCFQDESTRDSSVHRFWALRREEDAAEDGKSTLGSDKMTTAAAAQTERTPLGEDWKESIFAQICSVTGEIFEAAAREQMVHFQTLPNAFEIFGVDFLVDKDSNVWLLELNAYPDFKQTGQGLQDEVVGGLFEEVVKVVVTPFFGADGNNDDRHVELQLGGEQRDNGAGGSERLRLVKDIDLGRG